MISSTEGKVNHTGKLKLKRTKTSVDTEEPQKSAEEKTIDKTEQAAPDLELKGNDNAEQIRKIKKELEQYVTCTQANGDIRSHIDTLKGFWL